MAEPKLKSSSVTLRYSADDGFRTATTYTANGHHGKVPPEIPMLEALEELARLTALFGFGDEAKKRFDGAVARVAEWRNTQASTQKPARCVVATEKKRRVSRSSGLIR